MMSKFCSCKSAFLCSFQTVTVFTRYSVQVSGKGVSARSLEGKVGEGTPLVAERLEAYG